MKHWSLILITLICIFGFGCGVHVKHHRGFIGPDTWEATDGKVSVHYYRGHCMKAPEVLQFLAEQANSGKLDWSKMADEQFKQKILSETCNIFGG